jgi:hypothetical protein
MGSFGSFILPQTVKKSNPKWVVQVGDNYLPRTDSYSIALICSSNL